MIWLAWRRNRGRILTVVGGLAVLGLWMVHDAHAGAVLGGATACSQSGQDDYTRCTAPLSPGNQAVVINGLLLFLPCLLGLLFGAPLVAGEAERATHRLAWTQHRSRTRWFVTTWVSVALVLTAVVAAAVPLAQWWSGQVSVKVPEAVSLGGDRIQPNLFSVTGLVPVAYSLFALALGAALGAILRRTSLAVVGTIVVYSVVALVMVFAVRPALAPTGFLVDGTTDSPQYAPFPDPPPWNVAYRYRAIPGSSVRPGSPSPDAVALRCSVHAEHPDQVVRCMSAHGVEGGFVFQPPSHYWRLQMGESLLYLVGTGVLFGLGVVAVRRMRD